MSPVSYLRQITLACALVVSLCIPVVACGALVDRLQVVPDGSSSPPGYLVTAHVYRTAEEAKASAVLRAFLVLGQRQELVLPIPAAGQKNRDAKRNFSVRLDLPEIKEAGWSEVRCVVPYADLQLNAGTHRVGFDLTVLVSDKAVLSIASELLRVKVADGVRSTMQVPKRELTTAPPNEKRSFYEGGAKSTTGQGPAMRNAEIVTRQPREVIRMQEVAVRIPGGFENVPAQHADPNQSVAPADQPGTSLSDVASPEQRTVFFATNRRPRGPSPTNSAPLLAGVKPAGETAVAEQVASAPQPTVPQFSADIDDQVHYGTCQVNIPVRFHHKGQIELPSWWALSDSGKVFTIASGESLLPEAFTAALGHDDIVLFVHGFDNTFEDAIFRAAQVAYDTGYAGRAVVFSWASYGDLNRYLEDGQRAEQSVASLVELLKRLSADKTAQRKIHIIAHSMGNRILLKALYELRQNAPAGDTSRPFGQIVLAAPDVSAANFNLLVDYAIGSCEQMTYYFCPQDLALKVSQEKNKAEPVGLYPYFQNGLVTIDAESANNSFIGHSYFAEAEPLLLDINLLVAQGLPPAQRKPPLAGEESLFGHEYWVFGSR